MNFEENINKLITLGADDFKHLNGSLITHLNGTYKLLKFWQAEIELCTAGLYHAIYGTSGLNNVLISINCRKDIQEIIGNKAERIVYTYCACNRDFFWPQIGIKTNPIFEDRFTGDKYYLSLNELKEFCELTVANELEIAKNNHAFIKKYKQSLGGLFHRMKPYISILATKSSEEIFGDGLAGL
ncbi:MAG: hypothetical protein H0U75_05500 [Legionella sp.]|nr:hypothetical protein [Legionella sp.]